MPGASSRPEVSSDDGLLTQADAVHQHMIEAGRAAIGVRPVTDTVKQIDADGFVIGTVDRALLRTPVQAAVPGLEEPPGFRAALELAVAAGCEVVELPPE